ncbi:hypothetical protein JXA63_03220 [Candidatus Woesebacteria bacterium]|nr:hypothetical protein [Candidatus Woesebacteria bacterium]
MTEIENENGVKSSLQAGDVAVEETQYDRALRAFYEAGVPTDNAVKLAEATTRNRQGNPFLKAEIIR